MVTKTEGREENVWLTGGFVFDMHTTGAPSAAAIGVEDGFVVIQSLQVTVTRIFFLIILFCFFRCCVLAPVVTCAASRNLAANQVTRDPDSIATLLKGNIKKVRFSFLRLFCVAFFSFCCFLVCPSSFMPEQLVLLPL